MSVREEEVVQRSEGFAHEPESVTRRRGAWLLGALRVLLVVGLLLAFAAAYYQRTYPGYLEKRACDAAQIARNISSGKGFTTSFIRPFNVSFMKVGQGTFPEMNAAPLFPYAASVLFKLKAPADQSIVQVSLLFFGLTVLATVWLGALLFDLRTGLLGAAVLALSAPVLNIGISGELWSAAALIATLLLCFVALYHKGCESRSGIKAVGYAALFALFIALLHATHYPLVLLGIPVLIYLARTGKSRVWAALGFLIVTLLLIAPLSYRNYTLTGCPILGITAWDMMADSLSYPDDLFYRSVRRDVAEMSALLLYPINHFGAFMEKSLSGAADLAASMIAALGLMGLPFAAVSALYRFRNPHANAVRGLAYGFGAVFVLAFGLLGLPAGCVLILCPLVAVTSAGYLFLLMSARKIHPVFVRFTVAGAVIITLAPALSNLLWPSRSPESDYYFKLAQTLTSVRTSAPIYSGQPWTVAWRTLNMSVWLPVSDADVVEMGAMGLPMNVILMTPECRHYPNNDLWRALYTVPLWLNYALDPGTTASSVAEAYGASAEQKPLVAAYLNRQKRFFKISAEQFRDMKKFENPGDPLWTNDVLIIHR